MNKTLLFIAAPLALAVDCSVAAAAPTAVVGDQLVEVAWTDADKSETKLALALPPDKGCSSVEMERDKRGTQLNVCRISPDGEVPVLQFSVERFDAGGTQKRVLKLHATVRMNRGAKVVIGRFSPGESATELLATLR